VLVQLAEVCAGQRVLDAAAGDGNVAAAALARGAAVDAWDLVPAMVERGRARCPDARWQTADVQELPYDDGSFDAVLSSFGAVLAPRARRTAHELVRIARPGGVIALTAWIPRGLPGRLDEFVEQLAPAPSHSRSPTRTRSSPPSCTRRRSTPTSASPSARCSTGSWRPATTCRHPRCSSTGAT
jgi:SAM-dependent methyltransferase